MTLTKLQTSALWVAIIFIIPATLLAGVTIDLGFSNPRFQVFVIGDVIEPGVLENGGSIDLNAFAEFFYMQINSTADLDGTKGYLHFYEELGGTRLVEYWSDRTEAEAFTFGAWKQNSPNGVGKYWNTDLPSIEGAGWFNRDRTQSEFAEVSDVLDEIENGLFKANTFTIGFEVFSLDGQSLASLTRTIQVYNPSSPALSSPAANAEIRPNTAVNFSWAWASGGPTVASDWNLILVDGGETPQDDGDAVIKNRTQANIRFDGTPQTAIGHNYTGNGPGETELVNGHYYYWQVSVKAPTIVSLGTKGYTSPVRMFRVNESLRNIEGYNSRLYRAYFETGELGGLIQDDLERLKGYVPVSIERSDNEADIEKLIDGLAEPLRSKPQTISKELR